MQGSILGTATGTVQMSEVMICTVVSLALGAVVALVYMLQNPHNRSLGLTLALLPALVQAVILVVNGNLGAGVAVMGAFSLVRFRSVPGGSKEIACIFFAMAIGLTTGMGYVLYAALFTVIIGAVMLAYHFGADRLGGTRTKSLRVTIPEDLDYTGLFDDLFQKYAAKARLDKVRSTNLGSLFELQYTLTMRDPSREKQLLDDIRKRNGNLQVMCGTLVGADEQL